MKINYITEINQMDSAIDAIGQTPVLGIDTETTGYTTRGGDVSLLQIATSPEEVYVFNVLKLKDQGASLDFLYTLLAGEKIKVFQNAKFDLQFIQKMLGKRLRVKNLNDTMLSSILLAFGDKRQRHSLSVISERELGRKVDKSLQSSDFSGPDFSEDQLNYAAMDAGVLLEIREKQAEKITAEGLRRCARLEFDAVTALAEMEYHGIYLDEEIWMDRSRKTKENYVRVEDEIWAMVKDKWPLQGLFGQPSINLASPQQVKELLHRIGVMAPDTDEDTLKEFESEHPVISKLLEFRDYETSGKKFGETYLRFVDPVTRAIHASFRQIEAPTGRMSCTQPNLMQLPSTGPYREAFTARYPGGKIITADYSQIEIRIMANRSGDPILREAFLNDEDLHNKTAHLVLGEPLDNPNKQRRVVAKNLNFGTAYGAAAKTFARLAKVTEREAQKLLDDYWSVYKVLGTYLTQQGNIAVHSGIMKTASGRKGKLLLDMQDPINRSKASRLGRNFGIQGTGADIIKTALYRFRENVLDRGLDAYLVNVVHDEIVVEANSDAEEVAQCLNESMIDAASTYLGDIPCKVDIRIADHWTK